MSDQPRSSSSGRPAKARAPRRATQVGVVTSALRRKTITVAVPYTVRHRKYGKFLRRQVTLQAHDENNECRTGDMVEVMHCRRLSKTKCWRLVRVVKRAPEKVATGAAAAAAPGTPRTEVPT